MNPASEKKNESEEQQPKTGERVKLNTHIKK
jgi:hypothetical protein